ncbi:MAG: class I SAM-dependent methyltransferase [Lachnospiraceae bacterium]|nr:class I SAM-dependent methyltransferase [Lachnospiraceae bacterium]
MDCSQKIALLTEKEASIERINRIKEIVDPCVYTDDAGLDKSVPYLELSKEGLSLKCEDLKLQGNFDNLKRRLTKNNLQSELLVKAAKIKGKETVSILDATAGLGEDSIILSAAGFNVTLYEYDEIIFALLEDSVIRAKNTLEYAHIANRMTLKNEDSIAAMNSLSESEKPDVILLDPMFPKREKSALIKKKFQLLQKLESPCDVEEALLNAAMNLKPKKIIIKRPLKGPFLAGVKPSYSLKGKAIRIDVIVNA